MFSIRSRSAVTVSLFLSYLLVILICSPFAASGGPSVRKSSKPMQEQSSARYRVGEVHFVPAPTLHKSRKQSPTAHARLFHSQER
jgi:hypothetical protein